MEEEKEKKANKPLIIFLVVFLLIILGGSIFFIYQMVFVGSDDNFLNVYKMNDGTICLVSEASDSCSELAFQIETENSDAKLVAVDSNNLFVLLDDNGLKLYNIEAKEITAVSLEDTYSDYAIYLNNDQDKVIGIVYTTSTGKVGYYNVSLNQKLYDDKYNSRVVPNCRHEYRSAQNNMAPYFDCRRSKSACLIHEPPYPPASRHKCQIPAPPFFPTADKILQSRCRLYIHDSETGRQISYRA